MYHIIYNLIFILLLFLSILLFCVGNIIIRFITIWILLLILLLYKIKKIEHYTNMNVSRNQSLINGVNPKTNLNPIITPPIFSQISPINTNSYHLENYSRSGYKTENNQLLNSPMLDIYNVETLYKNNYSDVPIVSNYGITGTYNIQNQNNKNNLKTNINDIVYLNDIYDPRYYGYGDVSTYFNEPVSNINKYDYSSIKNIRNPSIERNKIDFKPKYNKTYQDVTMDYIEDTNYYRYNIQESIMKKRNAELQEYRKHPHRRDLQFKFNYR